MRSKQIIIVMLVLAVISVLSCSKEDGVRKDTKRQEGMSAVEKRTTEKKKEGAREARKIIIAKVNGVPVTMFDLVRQMNMIAPRYIRRGEKTTPGLDKKIREAALNDLIFMELAVQEAVRQGITVTKEVVDEVLQNIKRQLGSKNAYQEYLASRTLTEDGLRKRIVRSHRFERIVAKEIYANIKIDDDAVRIAYEKTPDAYTHLEKEKAEAIIRKRLTGKAGEKKKREWERQLRQKAKIELNLNTVVKETEGKG